METRHMNAIALCISAMLSGCAYYATKPMAINYESKESESVGLIRIFENKGNTVLQFTDVNKYKPVIYSKNDKDPLKYEVVGQQLVVLPGSFKNLWIEAAGQIVTMEQQGDIMVSRKIENFETLPPKDQAQQDTQQQIAALTEVANKTVTDAPVQTIVESDTRIAQEVTENNNKEYLTEEYKEVVKTKNTIYVNFEFNSAVFSPTSNDKELLKDATTAHSIVIRGRTDSEKWDAGSEKIALARAINARNYLVKQGVPVSKMRVFYLSHGNFLVKNDTEAGRKLNRRVEIEMLNEKNIVKTVHYY